MTGRDESGLIVPRKLCNPCLESPNVRDLNRQIKWNAKAGLNVLSKSELEKVLDRQRRVQLEKEREKEEEVLQTPFEKMLAERAKRLEQIEKGGENDTEEEEKENPSVKKKSSMFEQSSSHLLKLPLPTRKYSDSPRPSQPSPNAKFDIRKTQSSGATPQLHPHHHWTNKPEPSASEPHWEGNSSGSSSKSSSPEPESEFLKVFAQLRGAKAASIES